MSHSTQLLSPIVFVYYHIIGHDCITLHIEHVQGGVRIIVFSMYLNTIPTVYLFGECSVSYTLEMSLTYTPHAMQAGTVVASGLAWGM